MSDEYAGNFNLTRNRWEPVIDGKRKTLHQWSQLTGVSVELMCWRIKKGWAWDKAIFRPARNYKDNLSKRHKK